MYISDEDMAILILVIGGVVALVTMLEDLEEWIRFRKFRPRAEGALASALVSYGVVVCLTLPLVLIAMGVFN